MEAIGNATVAAANINYTDVVKKFKEMKSIFYNVHGCIISTLMTIFLNNF